MTVAIYPQPGVGPAPAFAQIAEHARVFLGLAQPGWQQVGVLTGAHALALGWVQANRVTKLPLGTVADGEEMEGLFTVLRTATFTTQNGRQMPIPYRYPKDGCFARAEVMANLLAGAGYTVDKEFAIAGGGRLRVRTAHGGDVADYGAPLQVDWWYHVAPVVYAQVSKLPAKPEAIVLDPSVADGALTPAEWAARMATNTVEPEMTYDALRQRLNTSHVYPNDRTWLVRSSSRVYYPPDAQNPANTAFAQPEDPALALENKALLVPAHDVVAVLDQFFRTCLAVFQGDATGAARDAPVPYPAYPGDLAGVRGGVQTLDKRLRTYIENSFPTFLTDWRLTFLNSGIDPDVAQLYALLGAP